MFRALLTSLNLESRYDLPYSDSYAAWESRYGLPYSDYYGALESRYDLPCSDSYGAGAWLTSLNLESRSDLLIPILMALFSSVDGDRRTCWLLRLIEIVSRRFLLQVKRIGHSCSLLESYILRDCRNFRETHILCFTRRKTCVESFWKLLDFFKT